MELWVRTPAGMRHRCHASMANGQQCGEPAAPGIVLCYGHDAMLALGTVRSASSTRHLPRGYAGPSKYFKRRRDRARKA